MNARQDLDHYEQEAILSNKARARKSNAMTGPRPYGASKGNHSSTSAAESPIGNLSARFS